HVRFLGFRDDVSALLGRAGMFILPSVSEGISLTLLEAMAASLPVVATKVGGNAEVVLEGETGVLVPPESPKALACAILGVLRDSAGARRMGELGRRRVEAEFEIARTIGRYEALYLELLERRGRA